VEIQPRLSGRVGSGVVLELARDEDLRLGIAGVAVDVPREPDVQVADRRGPGERRVGLGERSACRAGQSERYSHSL